MKLLLALILTACAAPATTTTSSISMTTTQGIQTTTTTPQVATTQPSSTTSSTPAQACPAVDVILVDSNDVLNVRAGPNPSTQIVFTLSHNSTGVVRTTAAPTLYNGVEWWEVQDPNSQNIGRASSFFLTCQQAGFATNPQPGQVLAGVALHAAGSASAPPWATLVSPYGLTVEHFEAVVKHWPAAQNPFTDGTVFQWATEAGGPNSLQATFGAQVATLWLDNVLNDTQDQTPAGPMTNQAQQGAEAAPPWSPVVFTNLQYLSVYDPADDPNVTGLDWRTVYAYFDWTPGNGWRLRGLSFDSWAP